MTSLLMTRLRHAEDVAKAWAEVTAKKEISALKALDLLRTGATTRDAALTAVHSLENARQQLTAAERAVTAAMEDLIEDRRS